MDCIKNDDKVWLIEPKDKAISVDGKVVAIVTSLKKTNYYRQYHH